jgi:hypothetical protein
MMQVCVSVLIGCCFVPPSGAQLLAMTRDDHSLAAKVKGASTRRACAISTFAGGRPWYGDGKPVRTPLTRDLAARAEIIQSIERALVEAGVDVDISYPEADLRAAIDGHSILLIIALIFMAVLMAWLACSG